MRIWGSIRTRLALAVISIIVVATASATVTQVDGTILPVLNDVDECDGAGGDDIQTCLDVGEGVSAPNPDALNAIVDAAETPQIFLPNTTIPVVFRDISEGAGFENSFGYYNVGDDVLTVAGRNANLHPILGCGRPMVSGAGNATTHSGNPAAYFQNAEPGDQISVDFGQEQTAGRYKGGFIAFYLITPEDNVSDNNCGDFKNGSDGNSLFGYIYFTQKDLNNDGDFVHHLVYNSKLTDNRFYFGFEDLFRGGDNDFEDMFIRVDGLTPPCVPQAEVCDGLDNDCDGEIDADDPDLGGVGTACTCDGIGLDCDNGPRFGECQVGVTQCTSGEIVCHGTGTPSGETCNGLDDNCNNQIDDNPSGTGAACDGLDADLCPEGQIVCQSAQLVCDDPNDVDVEVCNGDDDDCDGPIDEGNPGAGGSCGSSVGVCTPGTFVCTGGGLVCMGGTGGGPEVCNGLDDDCDGVVDDSPTDVGQSCGATEIGECSFGQTICVGGSLSCAGEIGPSPETCNNLDDDCNAMTDDNPVDAGQPCGSSIGECSPGTFVCAVPGVLVCMGGAGPTAEMCNGLDDDCNGLIDDGVPGEGIACGSGMPPCGGGMTKCIGGMMECVGGTSGGTETCNLIDDDCDGTIDDGDLCNGGICDNGVCAAPCAPGEFPCPAGKTCQDGFCIDDPCSGVTCPPATNGDLQSCRDGACQPVCPTVTCPVGLVCRGVDASCVPDTCDYLPKCAEGEVCLDGTCTTNPCEGVTCPSEQFCRDGACVDSCEGVQCGVTQVCRDGSCVETGCPFDCGMQVCNPETGQCQDDKCVAVQCPSTQVCDLLTGECVPDPCQGVTCPAGQACERGQCGTSTRGELVTTGGGGGCDAGSGGGSLVVGLLAVLWIARRRRVALAAVLASALAGGGCDVNEYCLQCGLEDGDGGINGDAGDGGTGDGGGDGGPTCDPNQIRPETCNNADDDCDGRIDETIDLDGDELNCGACGVQCNKPGAQTSCQSGACTITGCFPGFNDENGDTTGPYASSDGCEYMCFQSNGGVEACDTLDNDCDGSFDEGFDLTMDSSNCGMCGRTCDFFEAVGSCLASTCGFDPAVDCNAGFHDVNGTQADGCEYQCTITNGGIEACDVVDNNCNGGVDEGFDFMTDPDNCGLCGRVCQFPNATASCVVGMCGFDPATDCDAGFVDANASQVDGCEYPCSPTNGGVEICDAIDNDCDGTADDMPTDAGGACASINPAAGACIADGTLACASGVLVCNGATEPVQEVCDNVDNDCNGPIDDDVSRPCYTGPMGTSSIGECQFGFETCSAGVFGACIGEVTPVTEQCNNLDDDCDGDLDEATGGGPLVQSCYSGPIGTDGIGTCVTGTQTCSFGAFGTCAGEVVPATDVCGDNLDTDCDSGNDATEGCLVLEAELRLDAPGGSLGEAAPGTQHSYDVVLARGGSPLGTNLYAAWSQLVGGATEVYLRTSTDGGQTWGTIVNVTSTVTETAVKPLIAVAPGTPDRVVVAYQTVTDGVRDIRVQVSTNGGASFGAASNALDAAGDSFHHALAVRGTTVVVAWERLDTTTLNRDVRSRTSTDGGASFATERSVNVGSAGNTTRFAGRPQVGITAAGDVVWVWREQRAGSTRDIFTARRASPGTAAPTSDLRIDGDAMQNRDSDFPVLRVSGASAYLVWQDVSTLSGGGADAMFARSTDGGVSWSGERVLDDPAAEVSSSFTPSLSVDPRSAGDADDFVAVAWEDRRQGTQVFTSVSADGGATFGAPVRASSDAGDPVTGQTTLPVIVAAGSGVLAVAYQNQQTNQPPHVFVASSIDSGATWTLTHALLDQGVGPAIAPQIVGSVIGLEPAALVAWPDFRTAPQVNGDIFAALSR